MKDKHGLTVLSFWVDVGGRMRITYQHSEVGYRAAHCRQCKILLPREVPRIHFWRSYSDWSGYYCLPCGLKHLDSHIANMKNWTEELQKSLATFENMKQIVVNDMASVDYKKVMDTVEFMHKVNGGTKSGS
jgi:hypothetical protein